ncbi:hypothetical protein CU098_009280, partial [Rhizopus stolonifer]
NYTVNSLPFYECVNCKKSIASARYAPHLEKCLGLAGRQSSRVASRRLGHSSDDNTASPESNHEERLKKKHNKFEILSQKEIQMTNRRQSTIMGLIHCV